MPFVPPIPPKKRVLNFLLHIWNTSPAWKLADATISNNLKRLQYTADLRFPLANWPEHYLHYVFPL